MDRLFKRAIAETFDEGLWPYLSAGAVSILTLLLQIMFQGWDTAKTDVGTWSIGLAAGAFVLLVVFLYELARSAYLIERDAHDVTKAELARIGSTSAMVAAQEQAILKNGKEFPLWQAACIAALAPFKKPVSDGMATYHLETMKRDFLAGKIQLMMDTQNAYFIRSMNATRGMSSLPTAEVFDSELISRKELLRYLRSHQVTVPGMND
jgi:hypothetical protein